MNILIIYNIYYYTYYINISHTLLQRFKANNVCIIVFSIKVTKGIISLFFLLRVGERKREKGMEYCERVQRRILGPFIHSTCCTHSWFLRRYHMDINSITVRHKKQFLELKKSYLMDSYIPL